MSGYLRTEKTARFGHQHNRLYDGVSKWKVGPGGINCPCCTKTPPGELKVKSRRAYRRTIVKREINLELAELD